MREVTTATPGILGRRVLAGREGERLDRVKIELAAFECRQDDFRQIGDGHLDACHLTRQQKLEVRDRTVHPELVEERP